MLSQDQIINLILRNIKSIDRETKTYYLPMSQFIDVLKQLDNRKKKREKISTLLLP